MGPYERVTCEHCGDTFSRPIRLRQHLEKACKVLHQSSHKAKRACRKSTTPSKKLSNSWNKKNAKLSKTVDVPPGNALRMPAESETVSSPIVEHENDILTPDDVKYINDLCDRAQENQKSVLVIAVDYENYQSFGSELGKQFLKEHSSIIAQFFLYCKDKNLALEASTPELRNETDDIVYSDKDKKSIKPAKIKAALVKPNKSSDHSNEKDMISDKRMDDSTASSNYDMDDYVTVKSELEVTNDIEEHDSDDDFIDENDDQGDEVDNDTNDDDDDDDDKNDVNRDTKGDNDENESHKLNYATCTREEFFQEVGQEFMNEEQTKVVDYILKKKFGPVKNFAYTVPDLNIGKYHCDQCGYKFLWKIHLDTHRAKFPNCKEVPIIGNELEALENKITFVHTELNVAITSKLLDLYQSCHSLPITCVICGRDDISSSEKFSQHLIEHFNEKTFRCNICNTAFASVRNISFHLREHFRKPYDCHKCSWRFPTNDKLTKHTQGDGCYKDEEKTTTIKSAEDIADCAFKCTICFTVIVGHNELRQHMSTEHQCTKDPLQCVLCDKKFGFPELYYTHLSDHQEQRQNCPYCSETFPSKSHAYHNHMKIHGEAMPYVCDMCGQQFKIKRYFNAHRLIHTGERPFICPVEGCSKGFRSKDGLKQHKWSHENTHFLCSFCGRKFKTPSQLNNHKKTHTIEWRYPCIYCDDKFHRLWPFKKHLAQKHPEKILDIKEKFSIVLHACTLCQKVYYELEDFRCHMNNHKGIKPFKCEHCEKCFTDKSNMKNHMKSHFGGKKLKCDQCSRKFDDPKYLEKHVQKHHGENSQNKLQSPAKINQQPDTKKDTFLPVQDEMYSYAIGEQQMLGIDDVDELRESTLQIIDETIREEAKF